MYRIEQDRARHLLRITLVGFWDEGTMAAYDRQVRQDMAAMKSQGGCQRVLIDMTDFAIQKRAIAEGHAANLRAVKGAAMRVALVVPGALSKLQVARVASDTGHPVFDDEGDAMAWLMAASDRGATAHPGA